MSRESIRERAEELGYTHNCRGCGQKSDTPWCGCDAGAPEDPEPEPIDPERLKAIDGLRQLADLIEENPEMAVPYEGVSSSSNLLMFADNKKQFSATIRAFRKGAKSANDTALVFDPEFPLNIRVFAFKDKVCEKRTVTRTVPEVHIPAMPAQAERTIPEHEETVIEYICQPFLGVKADA